MIRRVQLVGHRSLGDVECSFDGPYLLVDNGTDTPDRYGPCAVFSVLPVPEPRKVDPPDDEPEAAPVAGRPPGCRLADPDDTWCGRWGCLHKRTDPCDQSPVVTVDDDDIPF